MPTTDYTPVSWNGEPITTAKLNQMCNNTQWLFDRGASIRYSGDGITRDRSVKVIAGKTPFPPDATHDYVNVAISFGSFFSAGCHPVVTAVVEISGNHMRKYVSVQGPGGSEIDNTGFTAQVVTMENVALFVGAPKTITIGGWIHWIAVGY